MEPTPSPLDKPFRLILNLGKYQVIERTNTTMKIRLADIYTMTAYNIPPQADVKAGDILTFYTEVFYANPSQSSKQ